MKNTTRKVMILTNINSEIIEQAILILKDSAPEGDSAVIREAEKIVGQYMDKKPQKIWDEKKPKKLFLLSCGIAFVSISALVLVFFA